MNLKDEKVRNQKLYFIGYDEKSNRYLMGIVITWLAWYNRYYLITEEEYGWFDTDIEKLDKLAEECCQAGPAGPRFLCSDYPPENANRNT